MEKSRLVCIYSDRTKDEYLLHLVVVETFVSNQFLSKYYQLLIIRFRKSHYMKVINI